ncbi:oxidoreductase [Acrasis kona]|uniref:Oxidoreductase n=1 Tax=Acrasis kona TaxID=1008807 RepID=A0AAW2ZA95_9EUKA
MDTNPLQQLRFGILSAADIAVAVTEAIHESPLATVVAVAARDIKKAEKFAKDNNIPRSYGSYQELIDDKEVDAVYLPIPTSLRTDWAIKAARAGKHILVEKPLASAKEVRDMRKACRENNVLYMDNTMWVHHKRAIQIKSKYLSSESFKLRKVLSSLTFNGMSKYPDKEIRFNPELEPFGALGDLGWYNIRKSLWAFDYELPVSVIATASIDKQTGAIMDVDAILQFSNDRSAVFTNSMRESNRQWVDLISEEQCIHVDRFVGPAKRNGRNECSYTVENKGDADTLETIDVEECKQETEVINDFSKEAREPLGESALRWGDESEKTMIVLDAVYESIKSRGEKVFIRGDGGDQNLLMVGQ